MKRLPLFFLPVLLALLTGCGSDADPAAALISVPPYGVDEEGAYYIGTDRCLSCHENPGKVNDTGPATGYLASRHAQPGTVGADAGSACLACHDPIADGVALAPWFVDQQKPPAGMTAIGCESCHGNGSHHLAMIPAHPNAAPDYQVCGNCHTALPADHLGVAGPYADNIVAKYQDSAHARKAWGRPPVCSRCHSDEGFRAYAEETFGMEANELIHFMTGAPAIDDPSPVQCRTCHDSHTGELRGSPEVVRENGEEVVKYSRLFKLCTACHQVFLEADYDPDSKSYIYYLDTEKQPYHYNWPEADDMVITDTHFATRDGLIWGYSVDPASEEACLWCHDPHAASKPW